MTKNWQKIEKKCILEFSYNFYQTPARIRNSIFKYVGILLFVYDGNLDYLQTSQHMQMFRSRPAI